MTISCLTALMPPPRHPSESGNNETWPSIDGDLSFPEDYFAFIHSYGTGRIADFIAIFNPFAANEDINFFKQKTLILGDLESLNQEDPDYFKYPLYPAENGLLPIGLTDNGDYLFWTVSNTRDSNTWGTAIIAARSPDVEYFDQNLTTLLFSILTGTLKPQSLPGSFPGRAVAFAQF
ncbi:SMI1/KNR4 family protein [Corticimicrobacter populi]|uniref:SMI1/KNR4 family protein n=1 Tax=Corticimicrobacter populi TaxID=2175229 RepID=A0A2V1K0T6_9BURK|nr:SMI1/KNR4 family protein [Corticimicrobacter populi]PWF24731.1 SMI1/KNR4 family protein [Corticimicrobacter populi]